MTKRILFLMSDTGGGHRSAAQAIQAAMQELYLDEYQFQMVDVFRYHTPFPFKYMPEIYPLWVNYGSLSWKLGYLAYFSHNQPRTRFLMRMLYFYWRRGVHRIFEKYQADVIVCVHSLFNYAALRALEFQTPTRPPFVTVVTDLVSTPIAWYQHNEDLCLVPTPEAYDRGLRFGMRPDQMKVTGLPVHPNFVNSVTDKKEARQQLGWHPELRTVLLVSGGDGMGPVFQIARAINDQKLNIQLAILAGRNEQLKEHLEACEWNQPTYIYPFVNYMARLMTAADILVTKSGPSTIAEACVAGLPMILSGKVPGQEDGNVELVVKNGAGVYAPGPRRVAKTLQAWVNGSESQLVAYSEAARKLARPQAAWMVAEEIHQIAQNPPLHVCQPVQGSWSLLLPGIRPKINNPPKSLM